jgi:ligand-binding sensor domain-containing protein
VKRVIAAGLVAMVGTARADAPRVRAVMTNTDEVRACLALPGGDTLVGTAGGLVRVDATGAARRVWTASDGLPGTRIDALVGDGAHAWIGTDAGVAELADGAIARSVATKPVRDVVRLGKDIYLATWDGGVVKLGAGPVPMVGGTAAARARVSSLAVANGTLWAGSAAGLYRLTKGRFERVEIAGPRDIASLAGDGDSLWIGAANGLWLRDGDAVSSIANGEVTKLAIVDGRVEVAGPEGLAVVERGHLVPLAGAPKTFALAVSSSCAGGLDGLWLRTATAWTKAPRVAGPRSNDISALASDGTRLWVGTFDQGLSSFVPGLGWTHVDARGLDARINAIVVEPVGNGVHLWVATAEGLTVIDGAGAVIHQLGRNDGLPSRSVLSLARLGDGRIVAGTSHGAAFVTGGHVQRVGPRGLGDNPIGNVWAIAEAGGSLWLGTTTGVYRGPATGWSTKDGADDAAAVAERWQRFSVATGHLKDDWITALAVKDGVVFAGTYNGGVARLADDGDRIVATQLAGGWINPSGLRWDGDRLLASTMDGLVAGDGAHPTWTAIRDLPGKDTTAALRIDRTLWVATRRGLARIE